MNINLLQAGVHARIPPVTQSLVSELGQLRTSTQEQDAGFIAGAGAEECQRPRPAH